MQHNEMSIDVLFTFRRNLSTIEPFCFKWVCSSNVPFCHNFHKNKKKYCSIYECKKHLGGGGAYKEILTWNEHSVMIETHIYQHSSCLCDVINIHVCPENVDNCLLL